jgi:hypothetical protein
MFDKIPAQALSDTVAQQLQVQIEKGSFVKAASCRPKPCSRRSSG